MGYPIPVVPLELFPGDWCLNCVDPHHPDKDCHMLEMSQMEDGSVAIEPCGCNNSVTAGRPGQYVIRVTRMQTD
jgi:hypothetical protein